MNEKAIKNYLGTIEAAKSLNDLTRSGEIFEKARNELFKVETGKKVISQPSKGNTHFEELCCLGFYPQERRLEAVINIKQPYGYGGPLGSIGSYEYVAFYLDWNDDGDFNDTGESAGYGYVHVFDATFAIPKKKLEYCTAVYRDIIPLPTLKPGTHVRARAILSWQIPPTGPNFRPRWGNVMECYIRVDPIE